jgi:hypothetical protein
MRQCSKVYGLCGVVGMAATIYAAGEAPPSVKTLPPVVVKTVPAAGDTQVDAATTKEIRVTFSKKMTDKSWSWVELGEPTKLPVAGEPRYDADGKTCIVSVDLKPGRTYAMWINSEKFKNFRDTEGNPAVPYLLVFETKPAP